MEAPVPASSEAAELAAFLKCGIAAIERAQELFALADSTGSGAVDFNEFVALLTSGSITRAAEGGAVADSSQPEWGKQLEIDEALGDTAGRRRAEEAHRARMVDRAMERLTSSDATDVLAQINDPAADEVVSLFAQADDDYSGALTLPEFTQALVSASEHKQLKHGRTVSVGAMEARLWFASLDRVHRGYIDVCQWIQLLVGGLEGAGKSGRATTVDALDATVLRGVASDAARVGHLQMSRHRPRGVDEEAQRQARAAIKLLEVGVGFDGGAVDDEGEALPRKTLPRMRPALHGKTAAAEAAEDVAFAEKMRQRIAESEQRSTAEDARLHAYLSRIVAAAGAETGLTDAGFATLEAFSTEDLAAAIAMYERYDADGDGRLQHDEFSSMMSMLSRQHGLRFSSHETTRLFRTADLSHRGAVNLLELLLLLQQLQITPVAPAEAEAYRERLLQTAARSVVKLEAEAATRRRRKHDASGDEHTALDDLQPVRVKPSSTSVLAQPPETIDEVALLFSRFDGGRKGYLSYDEFAELKNALAVQSGGECFSSIDMRMQFNRADCDRSGTLDLNELYLHLRTAHPSSSAARGQLTAAPASMFAASIAPSAAVKLADSRVRGGGMSGVRAEAEAALDAVKHAEEARRVRIDALVANTAPALSPHVSRAFGEAELRALAAVFVDLDHGSKGALTLQEFRVLLAMLAERAAKAVAAAKKGRSTAPRPEGAEGAHADIPTGSTTVADVEPLGLREAHAIFRQSGLDTNAHMTFGALLALLADDEPTSKVALAEGRALVDQPQRKPRRSSKRDASPGGKARARTPSDARRGGTSTSASGTPRTPVASSPSPAGASVAPGSSQKRTSQKKKRLARLV